MKLRENCQRRVWGKFLRTCAVALVVGFVVALTVEPAAPEESLGWPNWRGPNAAGRWDRSELREVWPEKLPLIWSEPTGAGYSGLAVADGRLFTMDRPQAGIERVVCRDTATGALLWEFKYPADYGDLDYGKGPRATPTVHRGRIYALGAVGHFHCLDAATGQSLWSQGLVQQNKARQPTWGFAASPLIHEEKVILHAGVESGGCYIAFDRINGQEIWRSGDDAAGYCTPLIIQNGGAPSMLGWTPEHVACYSLTDGAEQWKVPYKVTMGVSIASPIFHDGLVLVSGYWEGTKAIRPAATNTSAEVVWEENRYLRGLMSQPLCRDGYVYLLDKQHGMVCFELASGDIRWTDGNRLTPRGRNPQVSLVWVGASDRAVCLNSEGELVLTRFTPAGFHELTRTKLIGQTWAHPAYVGRRVYARDDSQIVCAELP